MQKRKTIIVIITPGIQHWENQICRVLCDIRQSIGWRDPSHGPELWPCLCQPGGQKVFLEKYATEVVSCTVTLPILN